MYRKEAEEQLMRIAALEAANACPHDVRKQYEVLTETKNIIPDCEQRAERAKEDLSKTILTIDAAVSPALLAEARALL
jgi:tubulin-specific chaperone A